MTNSAKLRIAKQMMLISAALIAASSGAAAGFDKKTFRKPNEAELRKKLSAEQFEVTQHEQTERASHNAYWDEHRAGIYVDIVSREPLFSSLDKYDSGTGWPSFTKPLDAASLGSRKDKSLFATRTEIHSEAAKSHLGHVFDDGPKPLGKRYCMNSAALRFIPVADLKKKGYQHLLSLFAENKKK